ncbi:hypothetical protein EDB84DRAFT_1627452 [Lactarius hengduanensis]|nr:hypothetical protein EDB84DRAFT_1627452 [Lactarius hengduanensis]
MRFNARRVVAWQSGASAAWPVNKHGLDREPRNGTEVWKTVAYILDCLIDLSRGDKQGNILSTLVWHGFLGVFVRDIKYSDRRLQAVLKPEPDDLNSLYVFESKMSLLTRIAQSRQGAERLIEARVLPTLAICDFLDTRPDVDSLGHFLPSAIQRYHQLFLPALQLVDAILPTNRLPPRRLTRGLSFGLYSPALSVSPQTPPDAVAPSAVLLPRPKATHGQFTVFRRLTPL